MIRSNRPLVRAIGASVALVLAFSTASQAAFTINLNFGAEVTDSQKVVFNNAKATWESLIPGYQTGITLTTLNIDAVVEYIDGAGDPNTGVNILGSAGPTFYTNQTANSGRRYALATNGRMRFDSYDVAGLEANGSFGNVILHEMAHVMGFGTLWNLNSVYTNGTGQYTGANALAAYRMEFSQSSATFVPVELDGGQGTADAHWDELTNVFDPQGRTLSQELLTGRLDTNEPYISRTSIESFRDIGFAPIPVVVPEPATVGLMTIGIAGIGLVQVRRRKQK